MRWVGRGDAEHARVSQLSDKRVADIELLILRSPAVARLGWLSTRYALSRKRSPWISVPTISASTERNHRTHYSENSPHHIYQQ